MTAVLKITDGTTDIDLLSLPGFLLEAWRPTIPQYKGGGTFQSSPLSAGRQLVNKQFDNYIESFAFKAQDESQDDIIFEMQKIRRLMEKASDYWTTDWQDEPVWIEAKASCETNTRYALVMTGYIPEDENPYAQPFGQVGTSESVMDDMVLIVEHLGWTETIPSIGTATEINGLKEVCNLTPLLFDGTDDNVNLLSPAVLDDLHDSAFTAEAWIHPLGIGGGNQGRIFDKARWVFYLNTLEGRMTALIDCAVTDGVNTTNAGSFSYDDWVHVAMTWDDATYQRPRIWINGTEATYGGGSNRNGAIVSDAANNLYIGNSGAGTNSFDGDIGWARISDSIRYTAAFTPPERCVLPNADTNTVWLGIVEGVGSTVYDHSGNANDGAITSALWDADEACCEDFGRESTTTDEVYLGNKNNKAQLTHVFISDGGVYGANLLGSALPYDLLPAVPAVNDAIYFGVDSTIIDYGAFQSLVFDLQTAQVDLDIEWEITTGAGLWFGVGSGLINVQDYTNADGAMTGQAFDTVGVKSITWQENASSAQTVNGVTAYWIRARVSAIGANPAPPTQQNRHPYTVINGYVDIDSSDIIGDIPATYKITLTDRGDKNGGTTAPQSYETRCIIGLRSKSRGIDFSNDLFLAGYQNPTGITLTYGALTSAVFDLTFTANGYYARYLNNAGASTLIDRSIMTFSADLANQYYGKFRAFLRTVRVQNTNGVSSAAISIRLRFANLSGGLSVYSDTLSVTVPAATSYPYRVYDLGTIDIPGGFLKSSEYGDQAQLAIQIADTVGANTIIDLADIILIPVDEWAGDYYAGTLDTDARIQKGKKLVIDGIEYPKYPHRSILLNSSDQASAFYRVVSNGNPILQANADQRLWFTFMRDPTTLGTFNHDFRSIYSVQLERQSRYLSMRGNN